MNLTRAELAALSRRREQPVRAAGEILAVWVPGKLVNGKNASRGWQMKAWSRYKREWRDRTATAIFEARWGSERRRLCLLHRSGCPPSMAPYDWFPHVHKHVEFLASTWGTLDDDGLALSLAPVRDELIACGVISGDAPRDGHEFVYSQKIDRIRRGVEIRVRLR